MSNSNNTFARIPYTGDRKSLELCLEGQCLLYYQPQFDLQTGSLAGVEVLLRWHSPQLGWIPADRFIPIAFINWIALTIGRMDFRASLLAISAVARRMSNSS
jgi:EAL domain-containing protein (putative c-di-GMP-specific phosphodiesterase class I)